MSTMKTKRFPVLFFSHRGAHVHFLHLLSHLVLPLNQYTAGKGLYLQLDKLSLRIRLLSPAHAILSSSSGFTCPTSLLRSSRPFRFAP